MLLLGVIVAMSGEDTGNMLMAALESIRKFLSLKESRNKKNNSLPEDAVATVLRLLSFPVF